MGNLQLNFQFHRHQKNIVPTTTTSSCKNQLRNEDNNSNNSNNISNSNLDRVSNNSSSMKSSSVMKSPPPPPTTIKATEQPGLFSRFNSFRRLFNICDNSNSHKYLHNDNDDETFTSERCNSCSSPTTTTMIPQSFYPVFVGVGILIRTILLDIPLCICCVLFCTMCTIKWVHQRYYVPLMDRTARTDSMLRDEYTYYNRQCTEYDITTQSLHDVIVNYTPTDTDTEHTISKTSRRQRIVKNAVHQMLLHGGIILPNVLQSDTIHQLRSYIEYKNSHIHASEKYPVSQGKKRLSYGIDASEHFSVSNAIREILVGNNVTSFPITDDNNTNTTTTTEQKSIVRYILEELLGDIDPASAEITSITSYYGAIEQVWHMDTKIDGNAVKYARTYSHSYSLFVPLQYTTLSMGATDICPGSHMCSNDMESICERNKVNLHHRKHVETETPTPTTTVVEFVPGDVALLNQHVWHRGGQHNDPTTGNDRIVFVISFLARPTFFQHIQTGTRVGSASTTSSRLSSTSTSTSIGKGHDTRQLSRGTYFHQKWNMWGHTMNDLIHATRIMTSPYSILRCLRLWKFANTNWGYDLITSTYMRYMNEQLEDSDLHERFVPQLNRLGYPKWLRSKTREEIVEANEENEEVDEVDIPYEKQSVLWKQFIQETIDIVYNFTKQMMLASHGTFILFLCILWLVGRTRKRTTTEITTTTERRNNSPLKSSSPPSSINLFIHHSIRRLVLLQALIVLFFYKIQTDIVHSEWGTSIDSGTALMRPFPPVRIMTTSHQHPYNSVAISTGATTLPTRNDILIGTRYDSPFLGSYNQWLQYHPGNYYFLNTILPRKVPAYRWYSKHDPNANIIDRQHHHNPIFVSHLIHEIINEVTMPQQNTNHHVGARFLQQDYRTGDWRIMSSLESYSVVYEELEMLSSALSSSSLLLNTTTSTTGTSSIITIRNEIIRTGIHYMIAHWRFGNNIKQRTFQSQLLSESAQFILMKLKRSLLHMDQTNLVHQIQHMSYHHYDNKRTTTSTSLKERMNVINSNSRNKDDTRNNKNIIFDSKRQKISKMIFVVQSPTLLLLSKQQVTTTNNSNSLNRTPTTFPQIQTTLHYFSSQRQQLSQTTTTVSGGKNNNNKYKIGSLVWYYFDRWYPGTIVSIEQKQSQEQRNIYTDKNDTNDVFLYTISFDDGTTETNLVENEMALYQPITEGDTVVRCWNEDDDDDDSVLGDDCYSGTALRVMAGGEISIHYHGDNDDAVEWIVPPSRYYQPPFKH